MVYMLTLAVYWWQMLLYIAYMDPMGYIIYFGETWEPLLNETNTKRGAWCRWKNVWRSFPGAFFAISFGSINWPMHSHGKPKNMWNSRDKCGIIADLAVSCVGKYSSTMVRIWAWFPCMKRTAPSGITSPLTKTKLGASLKDCRFARLEPALWL